MRARTFASTVVVTALVMGSMVGVAGAGGGKAGTKGFCEAVEAAFVVEDDDTLRSSEVYEQRAKNFKKVAKNAPNKATVKAAQFLVKYFNAKARDADTPSGFLKAITAFNKRCGSISIAQ